LGRRGRHYIINTCTVTNRTDYKSRYLIRRALDKKKGQSLARVVVTGCFAQRSRTKSWLWGRGLCGGQPAKAGDRLNLAGSPYSFMDIMQAASFAYRPYTQMYERTRAFMKVQTAAILLQLLRSSLWPGA
jgi:threonylcarbamoyladenosine tRNA methylthiotransferase MtaB